MGNEDFAYMRVERSGTYFFLGGGKGENNFQLHHPSYNFNDDLIPIGVTFWTELAETYLNLSDPMPAVYEFNAAIVRSPGVFVAHGLRADDRGNPTHEGVAAEHSAYIEALHAAGVDVTILPPLEAFPIRSSLKTRRLSSRKARSCFGRGRRPAWAEPPESRLCFARSSTLCWTCPCPALPTSVLYFKTDCSLLNEETVLVPHRLAGSSFFNGLKEVVAPEGNEPTANALRVNGAVFVCADYPRTIELLDSQGYNVVALKTRGLARSTPACHACRCAGGGPDGFPVQITLPGFRIPFGSCVAFSRRITSSSASPRE